MTKNNILGLLGFSICVSLPMACGSGKKVAEEDTGKPTPGLIEPKVESESICSGTNYTYKVDIKPIMDAHCAKSCHSAEKHASGMDLSTYEKVVEFAPKKYFMASLKHIGTYAKMPKNADKLSDESIQILDCWIETGMAE